MPRKRISFFMPKKRAALLEALHQLIRRRTENLAIIDGQKMARHDFTH